MKIVCNKTEFAALVRYCAWEMEHEECAGCPFVAMCSNDHLREDGVYEISCIEDLCEVERDG